VARRVDSCDLDGSDGERVSVVEPLDVVLSARLVRRLGPLVLPVLVALVREVEGRVEALGKLAGAGKEVGVNVRFGDPDDRKAFVFGDVEVLIDVPFRIHEERLSRFLTPNEVGVLRELLVENLSE